MSEAKLCSRCGGPEEPGDRFCRFCGVSFLTDEQKQEQERARIKTSLQQAFGKLAAPVTPDAVARAVVAACAAVLPSDPSAPGIAKAVVKLTSDFCGANRLSADANIVQRVFESYVKARGELRRESSADINLPFLGVGPAGPIHLNVTLTREDVARLEA